MSLNIKKISLNSNDTSLRYSNFKFQTYLESFVSRIAPNSSAFFPNASSKI